MLDKLAELSQRFDEVNEALADPDVVLDQARYQRLSREHSDLEVLVQTFRDFQKIQQTIEENQTLATDSKEDEELRELAVEAKAHGLAVVVWSYPRGGNLSKEGETALDVTAYAAHMAALLGAHIIKVKPPAAHLEQAEAAKVYQAQNIDTASLSARVAHIIQSSFAGRRIVVFSGGAAKGLDELYEEIRAIRDGGGFGSIIGRNTFQRPRDEALAMLDTIIKIYQNKA